MTYQATRDTESIELPCYCEDSHTNHFAIVRKELGGKAILEVFDIAGTEGEVAGVYRAVHSVLVDWDLPGPDGDTLPITRAAVDELRLEVFQKLRGPAMEAVKRGNTPLPNGSGGRSAGTSPAKRSRSRAARA